MTIVEMAVDMDSPGCEKKIRKAIKKLTGVDDVDVDMARQKVLVMGSVDQKEVLKAVRKTGRRAVFWSQPVNGEYTYRYNLEEYNRLQRPSVARRFIFNAIGRRPKNYNYYNHGYDDSSIYAYYPPPPHSQIVGEDATAFFSDDNPNACSVM